MDQRAVEIVALCDGIHERAEYLGSMVAVRFGDDAVTYRRLSEVIVAYRRVADRFSMSLESALTAAVLSALPGMARLSPRRLPVALAEVESWLARDPLASHGNSSTEDDELFSRKMKVVAGV